MALRRVRNSARQCHEIPEIDLRARELFGPFTISAALVNPLQTLVRSLLVGKMRGEVATQSFCKQRPHSPDPVGASMITRSNDMLVDVVTLEPVTIGKVGQLEWLRKNRQKP